MTDDIERSPDAAQPLERQPERQANGLLAVLRSAFGGRQNGSVRAEIEEAIAADEAEGTDFSPDERAMLRAILRLGEMRVEDVMVPRADIESVDMHSSVAAFLATAREEGHSRLPVYRDTLDDPVGMAHIKDLMTWIADTALRPAPEGSNGPARFELGAVDLSTSLQATGVVRPVLFVPPSMPARILLKRMQATRTQMALVIDEYGGTDGLVSLEDLIEVIVGEIEDEHDLDEEPMIHETGRGHYVADARTSVEEARALIGADFAADTVLQDIETVGGLVFSAIGRIPLRGETVEAVDGFEFEIVDADPRRINKVRIRDRRTGRAEPRLRSTGTGDALASTVETEPGAA